MAVLTDKIYLLSFIPMLLTLKIGSTVLMHMAKLNSTLDFRLKQDLAMCLVFLLNQNYNNVSFSGSNNSCFLKFFMKHLLSYQPFNFIPAYMKHTGQDLKRRLVIHLGLFYAQIIPKPSDWTSRVEHCFGLFDK